jgi:hypothetical protein
MASLPAAIKGAQSTLCRWVKFSSDDLRSRLKQRPFVPHRIVPTTGEVD